MSDQPSFINQKFRVARKQHKCCECYQPILPGEKYKYTFGVWDGDTGTYRQCITCSDILDVVMEIWREGDGFDEELPEFGGLFEWVSNEISSYPESIERFEFNGNPRWAEL